MSYARKLREEFSDLRAPLEDPTAAAIRDVEAGVSREEGAERFAVGRFGVAPEGFDPVENPEHQRVASRVAELTGEIEERRGDVRDAQRVVDDLPGYPGVWILLVAIALPCEIMGGLQLFQAVGLAPVYRPVGAVALAAITYAVATALRTSQVRLQDATGWPRVTAWLRLLVVVGLAAGTAIVIAFARLDPGHDAGLPTGVRLSRLILLIGITLGPAIAVKHGVDRIVERLRPVRTLRRHAASLKRAEAERSGMEREVDRIRKTASDWQTRVAAQVARYRSAYDHALRRRRPVEPPTADLPATPFPADRINNRKVDRKPARRDDEFQD